MILFLKNWTNFDEAYRQQVSKSAALLPPTVCFYYFPTTAKPNEWKNGRTSSFISKLDSIEHSIPLKIKVRAKISVLYPFCAVWEEHFKGHDNKVILIIPLAKADWALSMSVSTYLVTSVSLYVNKASVICAQRIDVLSPSNWEKQNVVERQFQVMLFTFCLMSPFVYDLIQTSGIVSCKRSASDNW